VSLVVTWNAVLDGNRLAHLALALAIGVDGLVFVAGLFGAAAARSPLSDLPGPKALSAGELEAVVCSALGEDRAASAELVLSVMRPMGAGEPRAEVNLAGCGADTVRRVRRVLVAGASIGAVERASQDLNEERYLVRPELFQYLSVAAAAARDRERSRRAEPNRNGSMPAPGRPTASEPPVPAIAGARAVAAIAVEASPTLRAISPPISDTAGEPDMDDRHERFWGVLLRELKSEAAAVGEELDCQGGARGDLGAVLERIARGSKRALARAVRLLEPGHEDGRASEPIAQSRREADRIAPALMLLPEMGLLDILIAEAEKASDDDLLSRLRNLGTAIEGMERVDDAAAWEGIARRIRRLTG